MNPWLKYIGIAAATGPLGWTLMPKKQKPAAKDCGCWCKGKCKENTYDHFAGCKCGCNGGLASAKALADKGSSKTVRPSKTTGEQSHDHFSGAPETQRPEEKPQSRSSGERQAPRRIRRAYRQGKTSTTPATTGMKTPRMSMAGYYRHLNDQYNTIQVKVSNTGNQDREIRLWGANSAAPVTASLSTDVEDHQQVAEPGLASPLFNHPAGAVFNPVDRLIYVTSQLSDQLTLLDKSGNHVATVKLNEVGLGTHSPVAAEPDPVTGKVYVAASVANAVTVIDTAHQKEADIAVGLRPVALTYNPVNRLLYVANYEDDTLSVIDPATNAVTATLATGRHPRALCVDPVTGDVIVACKGDNTLHIFDAANTPLGMLAGLTGSPASLVYHPGNGQIYAAASATDRLYTIDPATLSVTDTLSVGIPTDALLYNPGNNYLYLVSDAQNKLTILDDANNLVAEVTVPKIGPNLVYHPDSDLLFAPNAATNTVPVIGFGQGNSGIDISDEYAEAAEDFQFSPALVKHIKWVQDGPVPVNVVKITDKTPTGKADQKLLHLNNHRSPQNYQQVAEVFESSGLVIDGRHEWRFWLAPGQQVTILIYYQQFERIEWLPERSPPAHDLGMSTTEDTQHMQDTVTHHHQ